MRHLGGIGLDPITASLAMEPRATAALPSVIGGPGSDFTRGGVFWL
jgi:hypothetical protein